MSLFLDLVSFVSSGDHPRRVFLVWAIGPARRPPCISARAGLLYFLFKSPRPPAMAARRGAGQIKPSGRLASLGGGWPQPPCRSPSSGGPALGTNFAPK